MAFSQKCTVFFRVYLTILVLKENVLTWSYELLKALFKADPKLQKGFVNFVYTLYKADFRLKKVV